MITLQSHRAPHPTLFHPFFYHRVFVILLSGIFSFQVLSAQDITGLEVIKTITHDNYSVDALASYFEDGRQLIAYSNTALAPQVDTLVIYDFDQDQVLVEIPGATWSYDIRFITSDHLLFRNSRKLYSVDDFNSPVINTIMDDVYTFTVSDDRSTVAMLRQDGDIFKVEVASYESNTGTITPIDEFLLPDVINDLSVKLSFSPDAEYLALSGGYENNYVYIINTVSGNVSTVNTPDNGGTYSPTFYDHNGILRLLVGGGFTDGAIEVIDVENLNVEASIPAFPHYNYTLDFDATHRYLVAGGYDGIVKLFRVDGTSFTELDADDLDLTNRVLFTQDNQYVISGHGAGDAKLMIHRVVTETSGTNSLNEQLLTIYPNPTSGLLFIVDDVKSAWVTVFDMSGRVVVMRNQNGPDLNLSSLKEGMYLLKVQDERGIRNNVFVKK